MKPKVSIVVPAYNEEARIEECLYRINAFATSQNYPIEIIISDDGSTDSTRNLVNKYSANIQDIKLLENRHRGKAPAIISGIYYATGEYILFTDVDLSVSIDELPKLLNWVETQGYDIAIASREGNGAKRINEPLLRHLMGRIFNLIVQIVLLPGINDTQCGFKLFRANAIKNVFQKTQLYTLDDPEIKGGKVSAFDVEILFVAKLMKYNIKEVPVTWVYGDKSKVHKLKDSYYNTRDVIKVRINQLLNKYKI